MGSHQQSVEEIFGAALDLPREQRHAFLERACREAPELQPAVEALLTDDERAGSFLAAPLVQHSQKTNPDCTDDGPLSPWYRKPPRFSATQTIADRFVVVRFIARGGMGEVYEVEDRFLQGAHVALKIIRPEIAGDMGSSRRFEQEVLLARKITHPNLCPIYEIFRCAQPEPAFLFLTMKLLQGETLEVRLRRTDPIGRDEASAICNDLVSAVRAMHSAGIIHRDIKPTNVMLEFNSSGLCASIMDFGLARLHHSETTFASGRGLIAGTPGYLAPELLQGHLPTQASDIYALGVVLHQVLTGKRPTETPSGLALIPEPALKQIDASPRLVQAIQDFIAADPEQRCRAFDKLQPGTNLNLSEQSAPRQWSRRTFMVAGAASVCAVTGGALLGRDTLYDLLHPIPSKRFVAVLNWPPPSDARIQPLVMGLIDTMASELSRAEAFDRNFYVASQERPVSLTSQTQLNDVRESLGANLVLATTGSSQGDNLHVVLRVLDPVSARTLRSRELRATTSEGFALPGRVVHAAAELLDVVRFEPDYRRTLPGTGNPEALADYQAAEAFIKQPNDTGVEPAIEKYKAAVEADPHYAIAFAQLAMAYLRLYEGRLDPSFMMLARANAETAIALDSKSVEGHRALATVFSDSGSNVQALHELALALSLDPSDTTTLTYQAQAYTAMNRWKDAEQTYKRVLKVRPNWWLPYSELGNNYALQGNYVDALAAYRAAATAARNNATPINNVAVMYFQLGSYDDALTAIERSIALAPVDAAYRTRSDILRAQGKYAEALKSALDAANINPSEGLNWLEVGDAYSLLPHHAKEAADAYRRAEAAQEKKMQIQAKDGPGWMILALYRVKSGDPGSAPSLLKKAESLGAGDTDSQLYKIRILELLGKRDEALSVVASMKTSVTIYQIKAVHDLDSLRADPRFPG